MEITEVRRQREDWQRDATRRLATGRTSEALEAYRERGHIHAAAPREQARAELVDGWDRARQAKPDHTSLILTHTNAEVRDLNELARQRLRDAGEMGADVAVQAERGERVFAPGDRIMFLKNERSLGVKNGTLDVVGAVTPESLAVRLDDGRHVAFNLKDYAHIDQGYAATLHKAQGVTVGRAHVLATPGMDRHSAYVGLSRHRDAVDLHYGLDDFADGQALARTLPRERSKDIASDYAREPSLALTRIFVERRRITGPEPVEPALVRDQAIQRHARAVIAIFRMQEEGRDYTPDQLRAVHAGAPSWTRSTRTPPATWSAPTRRTRPSPTRPRAGALRALQLEAELRRDPATRADRFVECWATLDAQRLAAYQAGDIRGERSLRNSMGEMAKSLERDPQLESILAIKKQALGLDFEMGDSLRRQLAISIGFDMGRGRGLRIGT